MMYRVYKGNMVFPVRLLEPVFLMFDRKKTTLVVYLYNNIDFILFNK